MNLEPDMRRELFVLSWRQASVLAVVAAASIGYAAAMRYLAIENASVSLACEAGVANWMCGGRKMMLALSQTSAFGWIAFGAAILNLVRPSIVLFLLALAAACFGLVLYNTSLSAVACALLVLSLARPAPEPE